MYYVYILHSLGFDKYYIGQTNAIQNRLNRHNSGYEKATKPYLPWELVCVITKNTRSEAMALEKKLKNLNKIRIRSFIEKYNGGRDDS
ncbi:GIY-YIG nuclease family protein [Flavobacterium sp.]|uniref:GIY-YIG nuclease family protein n=1 Tax=Flavobacterium sp. TaxID=239 RepID=UPI00352773C9